MRVYITISFGDTTKEQIEKLCSLVKSAGFEDFCFIRDVENYQQIFNNPKDLMQRSNATFKRRNRKI